MTTLRIGILEVGRNMPELTKEHGTFGEWFIPFLDKSGREIDYQIYAVHDGDIPESADECDAWLVTGSEVSTSDAPPWQAPLVTFLRQAADTRPVIGICYGHQLLHEAYGGRVERSPKGWGIGNQTYRLTTRKAWMGNSPDEFSLLVSHQDQIVQPAPNSEILGGSDFCPNGISLIGANILTMQPHPELEPRLAELVFRMRREEQGHEVTDAALGKMAHHIDDALAADWIVSFIETRLTFVRD